MAGKPRGRIQGRPQVEVRAKQWRLRQLAGSVGRGRAVTVDPSIYKTLSAVVQEGANKAASQMAETLLEFFREVQFSWPRPGADTSGRSTGYSYSRLGLEIRQVGDTLVASLTNDADYARFIVQDAYGGQKVFRRILFGPADKMAEQLAELMGDALAEV